MIIPRCIQTTSARYISLSRGVLAGLSSAPSWELQVWFDTMVQMRSSAARLRLSLSNFFVSYRFLHLPSVTLLISILSYLLPHYLPPFGRRGLSPVTPCNYRPRLSL